LAEARVARVGGAEDVGLRGAVRGGAIVSCSTSAGTLPTMVSSARTSVTSALPHFEQNLLPRESCAPQEEQNMRGRDSTIAAPIVASCSVGVPPQSRNAFDLHCSAIGEHFGNALHHFCGVVAHTDDSVGAMLRGVLQQQ